MNCFARFGIICTVLKMLKKKILMDECYFYLSCRLNFTKSNSPPLVFITFFKLNRWYQIAQSITSSGHQRWKVIELKFWNFLKLFVLLILNGFKRRLLIQLIIPYCSDLGRREKINLNFCFCTSLWCLKSLSEDLGGFHKAFCGPTKKCESKNLYWFYIN